VTVLSWHAGSSSVAKKQRRPVMCSTTSPMRELSILTRLRTQRSSRYAHTTAAAILFCSMSLSQQCTSLPNGPELSNHVRSVVSLPSYHTAPKVSFNDVLRNVQAVEEQIRNFGQTPSQLFKRRHVKRGAPPPPSARPLLNAPSALEIVTVGQPNPAKLK